MTSIKGTNFLLRILLFIVALLSLNTMADVPFVDVAELTYQPASATYQYGEDALQFAEYWQAEAAAPLVYLIHGGCWLNAYDLTHTHPLASALSDLGFAVFSVEYRRIGDTGGGWPGTFDDIVAGLDTARSIGHKNIFTVGHSAGGHLALWLAATHPAPELKGAIGLAAISDLVSYAQGTSGCEKATPELMGGSPESVPERYEQTSPLLLDSTKPTLLIHGDSDAIVDITQSDNFIVKHSGSELLRLKGKGHFDMIDPRQASPELIHEKIQLWLSPDDS